MKLRTKLETEFGMGQKKPTADDAESGKKSDPETNAD